MLSACHARHSREAGAVQVTTTVSACAVIVREDPCAEQDVLGMHRTATSGRAPDASLGAPILTTPMPRVGGFQEPRGDWTLRVVGSGAVEALDACARGDVDFFGSGRGRWVGADAFALVDGSGIVALGLGVDAGGVAEGMGVGIFVERAPARGFAVADVSDGAGNVIAESPKAPAGEVVVGEASNWCTPAATLDPMTPATPRTMPPARHAPTAIARARGVSCMTRPRSRPRSSGSL